MSVNKVILVGRLGKDPEVRYTTSGTAVASFSLATNRVYMNKQTNEKNEETEWHRIVAFGKTAEICGEYLNKGKEVYIEGRLRTQDWEDKEGNRRKTTEIIVENMRMLGSKGDRVQDTPEENNPFDKPPEDDVPF